MSSKTYSTKIFHSEPNAVNDKKERDRTHLLTIFATMPNFGISKILSQYIFSSYGPLPPQQNWKKHGQHSMCYTYFCQKCCKYGLSRSITLTVLVQFFDKKTKQDFLMFHLHPIIITTRATRNFWLVPVEPKLSFSKVKFVHVTISTILCTTLVGIPSGA